MRGTEEMGFSPLGVMITQGNTIASLWKWSSLGVGTLGRKN